MLTSTNHGPYIIPPWSKKKFNTSDLKDQVVEYADWSIEHFLNIAKSTSWFDNTIFVFIGDHGRSLDRTYNMSLSYNHVPLFFYSPNSIEPRISSQIGGQIDLFPTIMDFLELDYTNESMGNSLLTHQRPFIYFVADKKIGILDQEHFLIINEDKSEGLYHYPSKSTKNLKLVFPDKVREMKDYAYSMMQTGQKLLEDKSKKLTNK